jgi:photosystem II stability/assembly factor-like uncharacterized protein
VAPSRGRSRGLSFRAVGETRHRVRVDGAVHHGRHLGLERDLVPVVVGLGVCLVGAAWWPTAPLAAASTQRSAATHKAASHHPPAGDPNPKADNNHSQRGAKVNKVTVLGQPAPKGLGELQSVSCAGPVNCWAVGTASGVAPASTSSSTTHIGIDLTTDGGAHWKVDRITVPAPTFLSSVSCPTASSCMATGAASPASGQVGTVLVTTNGQSWKALPGPAGSVDVPGVTCLSATQCAAVATDGSTYWSATTTDGGRVWQRGGNLPAGFGGISGITCPSASTCLVPGYTSATPGKGAGAIALSDDGGAMWASASLPSGMGLLHAVACSGQVCTAVGTAATATTDVTQSQSVVLRSPDGGHAWTQAPAPATVGDALGVSCPNTSLCAAVGVQWTSAPAVPVGGVATTADGGAQWLDSGTRYVPTGLASVSCPNATSCVAVGNDVIAQVQLPSRPGSSSNLF